MLCTKDFFEKKKEKYYVSLMPRDVKYELGKKKISIEVKQFLTKFKEVVPDELLNGLPHVRGTSHQIDMISSLILLNRTPHILIPIESEEINTQFQEMLDREKIRESLIHCVVHVILTLKKGT